MDRGGGRESPREGTSAGSQPICVRPSWRRGPGSIDTTTPACCVGTDLPAGLESLLCPEPWTGAQGPAVWRHHPAYDAVWGICQRSWHSSRTGRIADPGAVEPPSAAGRATVLLASGDSASGIGIGACCCSRSHQRQLRSFILHIPGLQLAFARIGRPGRRELDSAARPAKPEPLLPQAASSGSAPWRCSRLRAGRCRGAVRRILAGLPLDERPMPVWLCETARAIPTRGFWGPGGLEAGPFRRISDRMQFLVVWSPKPRPPARSGRKRRCSGLDTTASGSAPDRLPVFGAMTKLGRCEFSCWPSWKCPLTACFCGLGAGVGSIGLGGPGARPNLGRSRRLLAKSSSAGAAHRPP